MVFGTDGVRGIVDKDINSQLAYNIGKGLALHILKKKLKTKVIIGKDTRNSGDIYLSAIASGLTEYGIDVDIIGIVSTPIISFMVSRLDYSAGVMITASHNDFTYNGIKVFNQFGEKTSKNIEQEIEDYFDKIILINNTKGRIEYKDYLVNEYINYLFNTYINEIPSINIIVDCANGSNYKIAPEIYKKLGLNVIEVCCRNDGLNINKNCGANCIENIVEKVNNYNADFGIAFDGDGDRLRIVLKNGEVLSGDDFLLIFALYLKEHYSLNNLQVAGTIMTNLGLEECLSENNISLIRCDVGDKNVIKIMKDKSLVLGGESSGHICLYNYLPNCDALYNSLFFLKCYKYYGNKLMSILKTKINYDNVTENIKVSTEYRKNIEKNINLINFIKQIKNKNKDTKIIVRPSGTEPVIRIYVEGKSHTKNVEILNRIVKCIKSEQ